MWPSFLGQNTFCALHLLRPLRESILRVQQRKTKLPHACPASQKSMISQSKALKNRRSYLFKMNPKGLPLFQGEMSWCLIAVVIRTFIFTLDSLGLSPKPAIKTLRSYLVMEARDKLSITKVPDSICGKKASVCTGSPIFCILVD